MKIVHVHDTAGIGSILSKFQRKAGHDAKVVSNVCLNDKYGIYDFYKNFIILYSINEFADRLIKECTDADIIHVHSSVDALVKLRNTLGKEKKIILHYHGTDIRGFKKQKVYLPHKSLASDGILLSRFIYRKIFHRFIHSRVQKKANLVCISTIDLSKLVKKAFYIPNPVDTEHFNYSRQESAKQNKIAVTINTEVTDMHLVLGHLKKNSIHMPIEVYDRASKPIMYKDMPQFLSNYETYVDVRYVNGKMLGSLSSTALQSLACGLNVLDYNLNYRLSLPDEHQPQNVASKVLHLYEQLLGIDDG